jgi:rare lipoprotein A
VIATLGLATAGVATMVSEREAADQLSAADPITIRSAVPRADRAQRPTPSPTLSPSPSPSPNPSTASPTAVPSRPPVPRTTAPRPAPTTATAKPTPRKVPSSAPARVGGSCGASYYDQGETTASGEPFDPDGLTAAHRTFAFNTRLKVTNTANGKSVTVRINDRGPFVGDRCLDLARGAFKQIASLGAGVITVRYQVL